VPLDPAQAQALAGAVLKAAEGALVERARGALQEARDALVSGQNWIETLSRMRPGSRLGGQAVGLARSMTKNLHRQLRATGEPLGFGMAAPLAQRAAVAARDAGAHAAEAAAFLG